MNKTNFRLWGSGIFSIWMRNFLHVRYTMLITAFWIFLEPALYLFAIGYGVGEFIPEIQGKTYLEFYFPGLLATTAMMVPFFESTYGYFSKLRHQKTYHAILLTPISVGEIMWGELLWAATKGLMSGFGILVIGAILGIITPGKIITCMGIVALISFVFAIVGMLFTTYARHYDFFIYGTSGFILPMSLFSDTYFPIERLPLKVQWLVQMLPLTHGVRLMRLTLDEQFNKGGTILHLGILIIFVVVLANWTYGRFRRILLN
jgi:lipooligosaccharide transport system permease protein